MGKLRVFISSTMKDLANERGAVRRRLAEFNLEPVNAESWLPDGSKSWERIEKEIKSSDLFVLIVGERYGWIPDKGPKAGLGCSVTHLEVEEARRLGIPVLPFLKELPYDADRTSDDAKKRDALREEVGGWDGGSFVAKFDDAFDLADKVGQAVIGLLTDEFQRGRISARAEVARDTALSLAGDPRETEPAVVPVLPPRLIDAIAKNRAILFAGSGVSLAAGLPSASAFAQSMIKLVQKEFPGYEANPVGSAFAGIATDVEGLPQGRDGLVGVVSGLVRAPQGLQPTPAHLDAVDLFNQIVTTNYDMLFEEAARSRGRDLPIISNEINGESLPDRAIVNLHGSVRQPESLVLTEQDVLLLDQARPRLWRAVRELLVSPTSALRSKQRAICGRACRASL